MPHDTSSSSIFGRISARSSFISNKEVNVSVQLLNDADSISHEFKRSKPAQAIIDYICEVKNIHEKDYLGLRYQDENKHRYWVDLSRPLSHILKLLKTDSLNLRLRFRFYPAEPTHLREVCSRYQLFVQLQRDLLHGRLYCPHQKAAQLAALILQAQLGDFNENEHVGNYVSQYTLLLKQTQRTEEAIAELHKSFRGLSTEEAESQFLECCSHVDTYGFDPYTVKEPREGHDVFIGVNHRGILIFQASQKVHSILWKQLSKVDYVGREIRILPIESYSSPNDDSNGSISKDKKSRIVLKYNCPNGHFAKHLWNHILSQQAFFNEQSALMIKPKFSKPRIPLLSRGSTFRFPSQRVLREIENSEMAVPDTSLNKSSDSCTSFMRYELTRHEPRAEQPWLNRYTTLPNMKLTGGKEEASMANGVAALKRIEQVEPTELLPDECVQKNSFNLSSSFSAPEHLSCPPTVSQENVTSFTVHLVKYERSPAPSPVSQLSEEVRSESVLVSDSSPEEPLLTSTPLFNTISARKNSEVPTRKSMVSNGSRTSWVPDLEPSSTTKTSAKFINVFFTSFLVFLLVLALFIAVFERRDGGGEWIESASWLSYLRDSYYEPARHYALLQYSKFVAK